LLYYLAIEPVLVVTHLNTTKLRTHTDSELNYIWWWHPCPCSSWSCI